MYGAVEGVGFVMNWLLDTFWPMRRITFAFTDAVSGRPVSYYRTAGPGRLVMAETRWSLFRVSVPTL